jgi:hypothetical protein
MPCVVRSYLLHVCVASLASRVCLRPAWGVSNPLVLEPLPWCQSGVCLVVKTGHALWESPRTLRFAAYHHQQQLGLFPCVDCLLAIVHTVHSTAIQTQLLRLPSK